MDDFYRITGRSIGDENWRVEMSIAANIDSNGKVIENTNVQWACIHTGTFESAVNLVKEIEVA